MKIIHKFNPWFNQIVGEIDQELADTLAMGKYIPHSFMYNLVSMTNLRFDIENSAKFDRIAIQIDKTDDDEVDTVNLYFYTKSESNNSTRELEILRGNVKIGVVRKNVDLLDMNDVIREVALGQKGILHDFAMCNF